MTQMKIGALILTALSFGLSGCIDDSATASNSKVAFGSWNAPPPEARPYGVDGSLNQQEVSAIMYLQFPQQYDSIKDRFGFPAYREGSRDFYRIGETNHWISIEYSGSSAMSYSLSD